uniref:Serine aminopeptidase S33 domain-containing protein n=1 Tax=Rhodosorus marinus TaxID=101924 RepID=A0A7S3ED82_9RHOD|mmetsp:Transcript_26864/g.104270  ORF Transcript_26864/g.104270 Transcript_26864/m.104270 type:complete len:425 (+) Transcript_26864:355-1629(+)
MIQLVQVFVLDVKSSAGYEFRIRKTVKNFGVLHGALKYDTPSWPSVKNFKSYPWRKSVYASETENLEAWRMCTSFVKQFLEDYEENKYKPAMKALGTDPRGRSETVGEHYRASFRCLFFLLRDKEVDKLDATGLWRQEQTMKLRSKTGHALYMRQWNPYDPKKLEPMEGADPLACLVILHGYSDTGDSYVMTQIAKMATAVGCIAYSVDAHGNGRSDGPRCTVRAYSDLTNDHLLLIEEVKAKHPGKKIFLIGSSMGGGLAVQCSLKDKDISGMILLAPMVNVSEGQSPILQKLAPLLAAIIPNSKIATLDIERLSHNSYFQRIQPYQAFGYDDKIVTTTGWQMLKFCSDTSKQFERVETPYIVFHGLDDEITSPEATKSFYERTSSKDKTSEFLESLYHELLMEDRKDELLAKVSEWITARAV